MERKVVKYAGAETMYFVSKKLKKKHNITDERATLYEAAYISVSVSLSATSRLLVHVSFRNGRICFSWTFISCAKFGFLFPGTI
ncbi:hypothetical protein MKW92_010457 [Papaver armeniacum]|nr:hypothetical protein MKW92_010457 [Papaver armeniacum]